MATILNLISGIESYGNIFIFGGLVFLFFKMRGIEKHLTNHVTGTERKIEKLDSKIDQFKQEIHNKLDSKIDQFKKETHNKLDDNFKHLNIRLDNAFSFNHQKASFLKEKNIEKPIK